jgi:hypothetical protein
MFSGAYDPSAWTGLVFCIAPGRGFAFRFAFEFDGRRYDRYDVMDIVDDIGPCVPDGSYGRLSLNPSLRLQNSAGSVTTSSRAHSPAVNLEWSKSDSETRVGRVSLIRSGIVEFRAYFPWDWSGSWTHRSEGPSVPEAFFCLTGTDSSAHDELHVSLLCTAPGAAHENEIIQNAESGEYQVRIPMEAGESLCFVAAYGINQRSTAVGVEEVERWLVAHSKGQLPAPRRQR